MDSTEYKHLVLKLQTTYVLRIWPNATDSVFNENSTIKVYKTKKIQQQSSFKPTSKVYVGQVIVGTDSFGFTELSPTQGHGRFILGSVQLRNINEEVKPYDFSGFIEFSDRVVIFKRKQNGTVEIVKLKTGIIQNECFVVERYIPVSIYAGCTFMRSRGITNTEFVVAEIENEIGLMNMFFRQLNVRFYVSGVQAYTICDSLKLGSYKWNHNCVFESNNQTHPYTLEILKQFRHDLPSMDLKGPVRTGIQLLLFECLDEYKRNMHVGVAVRDSYCGKYRDPPLIDNFIVLNGHGAINTVHETNWETIAHEISHLLGASHDHSGSQCRGIQEIKDKFHVSLMANKSNEHTEYLPYLSNCTYSSVCNAITTNLECSAPICQPGVDNCYKINANPQWDQVIKIINGAEFGNKSFDLPKKIGATVETVISEMGTTEISRTVYVLFCCFIGILICAGFVVYLKRPSKKPEVEVAPPYSPSAPPEEIVVIPRTIVRSQGNRKGMVFPRNLV